MAISTIYLQKCYCVETLMFSIIPEVVKGWLQSLANSQFTVQPNPTVPQFPSVVFSIEQGGQICFSASPCSFKLILCFGIQPRNYCSDGYFLDKLNYQEIIIFSAVIFFKKMSPCYMGRHYNFLQFPFFCIVNGLLLLLLLHWSCV